MPVYQYRCAECREVHEALQKMSDPHLTECPKCGGKLNKIIAPVGIIFKGSGWHINDYKPTPAGAAAADAPKAEKTADAPAADAGATPSTTGDGSKDTGGSTPPPPATPTPPPSSEKQVA